MYEFNNNNNTSLPTANNVCDKFINDVSFAEHCNREKYRSDTRVFFPPGMNHGHFCIARVVASGNYAICDSPSVKQDFQPGQFSCERKKKKLLKKNNNCYID